MKVTKKDGLMEMFDKAIEYEWDYVAVAIETRGSEGVEIIVNPNCNFESKKEYYDKAYDDDLRLKTFDGIQIVSAIRFDEDRDWEDVVEELTYGGDIY